MFDFEKLDVYQEMRSANGKVLKLLFSSKSIDPYLVDQFKRASLGALLNLSEGTGRMTNADKKRFYVSARASIFETTAIIQVLKDLHMIEDNLYQELYDNYEKISRMLLGMIRSQED